MTVIDPTIAGYLLHVFFLLKTRPSIPESQLLEELEKNPNVVKYWSVTGETDIIAEAILPDMNSLARIIEVLSSHGQITTHFVLFHSTETQKPLHNPEESET